MEVKELNHPLIEHKLAILRNKETGGLANIDELCVHTDAGFHDYSSLAELNEEWEDYEETQDTNYWYIDDFGRIQFSSEILDEIEEHSNNWMIRKYIGNYFDSREEAEKVVEKLKAWKRLKDKGFKFTGWDRNSDYPGDFRITASDEWNVDDKDLDLLFGGEE